MTKMSDHALAWSAACLFIVLVCRQAFGQGNPDLEFPQKSRGQLQFYTDICQFEGADNLTRCELTYSLDLAQLLKGTGKKNHTIVLGAHLNISDSAGKEIKTVTQRKTISLSDSQAQMAVYQYIDLMRVNLKPGLVTFKFSINDSLTGKRGEIEQKIGIRKLDKNFSLSDPSFVSGIQKASQPSPFSKHGLILIPAPSRIFRLEENKKNIYVYYEINHLAFDADKPSYYSCSYVVRDLVGNEIKSVTKDALLKKTSNSSRVEVIPISDFKSGIYKLILRVTDSSLEKTRVKTRYFWVTSGVEVSKMVLPMSDADAKKYYDQIKYIATNAERNLFKKLDARGKQEFLLKFWKSRDPNPSTPDNEFMEDYFRKIAFVKKNFPGGINSDRGRIYLQYGPPVEIEHQESATAHAKSVIIWKYFINGTTEFVFEDRIGDNNYILIHSNHPDEYHNPNWMNEIR